MNFYCLILFSALSVAVHAQFFQAHLDKVYPPIPSMNSCQLGPDGRPNPRSKYTSYRMQVWNPDSLRWDDQDSVVCFYDAHHNINSELLFKYSDGWQKYMKAEIVCTADGYPAVNRKYSWNELTEKWQFTSQTEYGIDTLARTFSTEQRSLAHDLDSWEHSRRNVYTYDEYGNEVKHLLQEWDRQTGQYTDESREYQTWDASQRLTSYMEQKYNSKDRVWINRALHRYSYGDSLVLDMVQEGSQRGWQYALLDSTIYDSGQRPVAEREYRWVGRDTGHWVLGFVNKWEYEAACPKNYTELKWSSLKSTDSLRLNEKDIRVFDANDNVINSYMLNTSKRGWNTAEHDSAVFDAQGNITYYLRRRPASVPDMADAFQTFYYYLPYGSDYADSTDQLSAQLFPNPSKGPRAYLKLNVREPSSLMINITDQDGKNVACDMMALKQGNNTLSIYHANLAPGTYTLTATDQGSDLRSTFKWVIE